MGETPESISVFKAEAPANIMFAGASFMSIYDCTDGLVFMGD